MCLGGRLASSVAAVRGGKMPTPRRTASLTLPAVNNQAAALKSMGALTDTELYRKLLMEILSKQPNLEHVD